jgi:hypothetical protein
MQWDSFGVVKICDDGRLRPKHVVRRRSKSEIVALLTECSVYENSDYISYASYFIKNFGPILISDRDVLAQIYFTLTSIKLH